MILVDENGNVISTKDVDYEKGYLDISYKTIENVECQYVVYRLYTNKQIEKINKEKEIVELKEMLNSTDYKAIKYIEGFYTEEEYEPIKNTREEYRERIRQLEKEIEENV